MSARLPRAAVVAVVLVAVVVVATAAPWLGTAAATTGASPSFGQSVVYEQRGDVATITVHTSGPATVNLGSREKGFWLQVRVGGGTTKLRLNTFKSGQSLRYSLSEMVWASKGSIRNRKLRSEPIDAPLATARYPLNVTVNGREQAIGTLVVEPRATRGVTASIAPQATDVSEFETAADVQTATIPPWNASVARDDWLVLHVNASGVGGALSKDRLDGDGRAGLRVGFVQQNPDMNAPPNEFTGASVERVFRPEDAEGFYLAVDTGEHEIDPGDRYEISFVVPADSPLADEREAVSTTIRVVERRVTVHRKGPGDSVVVEGQTSISGTTTLTPGTTINLTARDTGIDPFLRPRTVTVGKNRRFTTGFDFSDLQPGREFEIRLPDQGRTVPAVVAGGTTTTRTTTTAATTTTTATAVTATTTTIAATTTATAATATTTVATTTTNHSTAGEESSSATTAVTESTAEELTQVALDATERALTQRATETNATGDGGSGRVPGFGPVAAAVALAAAALLAVRRA